MTSISTYISEAVTELNQVRWPTRRQAIRLSVIVVAFTLISSLVFGLLDMGLSQLVRFLLSSIA